MLSIEQRFLEHIRLRAQDDRFIDQEEEKEILKFATEAGIELTEARVALREACLKRRYVLESYVEERGRAKLIMSLEDGQVDKEEFDAAVEVMLEVGNGQLGKAECRKRLKKIVVDGKMDVRKGFLKGGGWFDKIPD